MNTQKEMNHKKNSYRSMRKESSPMQSKKNEMERKDNPK